LGRRIGGAIVHDVDAARAPASLAAWSSQGDGGLASAAFARTCAVSDAGELDQAADLEEQHGCAVVIGCCCNLDVSPVVEDSDLHNREEGEDVGKFPGRWFGEV
jgi:hypothetical protein